MYKVYTNQYNDVETFENIRNIINKDNTKLSRQIVTRWDTGWHDKSFKFEIHMLIVIVRYEKIEQTKKVKIEKTRT